MIICFWVKCLQIQEKKPIMPPKNHKIIKNSRHLRVLLSDVINQLRNDEMHPNVANAIGSLANTMLKIIKSEEFEVRLKKLEDLQKNAKADSATSINSDINQKIKAIKTGDYKKCGT